MFTEIPKGLAQKLHEEVGSQALLGWMQLSGGKPSDKFRASMAKAWSILKAGGESPVWRALLGWLDNEWNSAALKGEGGTGIFAGPPIAGAAIVASGIFIEATLTNKRELLGGPDPDLVAGPLWIPSLLEYFASNLSPEEIPGATALSGKINTPELDWLVPIVRRAMGHFHDFVGYRPVPILESGRKVRVHNGERHRPGILWWPGVGVAPIPEAPMVARTIHWLNHAPSDILEDAGFSMSALTELAVDLREYDHSQPAAQRPNHLFGEWDPERVDNKGRFTRMVVRSMLLRLLWDQVENPGPGDPTDRLERLEEAAILLAGVILMSAGVLGQGPESVDPTKSLAFIIPKIAAYRDAFYGQVMTALPKAHRMRLEAEARLLKQPLGRVRQSLNRAISAQRATQLQNRLLARLFGRLGLTELAMERIGSIRVPSVRLMVEFERLIQGWEEAPDPVNDPFRWLRKAFHVVKKGVSCGAFADPWNLIGFQGLYPLGPAREDGIPDERLEDLRWMVSTLINECSRAHASASAQGEKKSRMRLRTLLGEVTEWWSKFPSMGVDDNDHPDAGSEFRSALRVARALGVWRSRGEVPADLPFWKKVLSTLETGEAVAEIFHVLLAHGDLQGALGILIYWIDAFDMHSTAEGRTDLTTLVGLWDTAWREKLESINSAKGLSEQKQKDTAKPENQAAASLDPKKESNDSSDLKNSTKSDKGAETPETKRLELVKVYRRAIDYIDANLPDDVAAPFLIDGILNSDDEEDQEKQRDAGEEKPWSENSEDEDDDGEEESPWSTDEDAKGGLDDGLPGSDFPAEEGLFNLEYYLGQFSAWVWMLERTLTEPILSGLITVCIDTMANRAAQFRKLMEHLSQAEVPLPGAEVDSVMEFERRRAMKFHTMERAGEILFRLEALLCLAGRPGSDWGAKDLQVAYTKALGPTISPIDSDPKKSNPKIHPQDKASLGQHAYEPFDPAKIDSWIQLLIGRELLHKPMMADGQWQNWISNRMSLWFVQRTLRSLARNADFPGIIKFLTKAHQAELSSSLTAPRVSDFHHYFEIAFVESFRAVFRVVSSASPSRIRSAGLFRGLMRLMEKFRAAWLAQGRQTRLSTLDSVDDRQMEALRGFIRHFGRDLFPARLMGLGNIRGILDRGVAQHLANLERNRDPLDRNKLLEELGGSITMEDASSKLELILRAVAESYDCFKDYKSTTTVSDYGENLHVLLDFLRIKAAFTREVWNRGPWYLLHREMLEAGLREPLEEWIGEVMAEFRPIADQYLQKIADLEKRHGVRLLTVRQEIEEGLWMPMENESLHYHLRDLCELKEDSDQTAYKQGLVGFRKELAKWVGKPWGVGRDAPDWIRKLDDKSASEGDESTILRFGPLDPEPSNSTNPTAANQTPSNGGGLTLEIIRDRLKELDSPSKDS